MCYPPIEPGEASLRSYYGAISAALSERAGPYVSITDATGIDRVPDARERKLHGELSNDIGKSFGTRCVMAVLVVPSALVRAAVTAVTWFVERPVPMEPAKTVDEAIAIGRRALGR